MYEMNYLLIFWKIKENKEDEMELQKKSVTRARISPLESVILLQNLTFSAPREKLIQSNQLRNIWYVD